MQERRVCVPGVPRQGSFPFGLVASHDALCKVVRSGRELSVFPTVSTLHQDAPSPQLLNHRTPRRENKDEKFAQLP